jgi:hypothetical protein
MFSRAEDNVWRIAKLQRDDLFGLQRYTVPTERSQDRLSAEPHREPTDVDGLKFTFEIAVGLKLPPHPQRERP